MKKYVYALVALVVLPIATFLVLSNSRKPSPTAKTEIGKESIRADYGLPGDAEIKEIYASYRDKPRICTLTPLNKEMFFEKDVSGDIVLRDGVHQEVEMLAESKWATYRIRSVAIIIEPTELSEKYVEDGHFCLGDYVPNGRVIVKSPGLKNGEITSFNVTLDTSEERAAGVPAKFQKLAIFDPESSVGVAFEKMKGEWKIVRAVPQGVTN